MRNISIDVTKVVPFIENGAIKSLEPRVRKAQEMLENGTCPGNDFLGWLHLPSSVIDEGR